MNYLSEPCRKMLEATLYNLYRRSGCPAEFPDAPADPGLMSDAELERLLNNYIDLISAL